MKHPFSVERISDVIARVWPDAYRLARSILGDHAEAEDAAQEACAKLCNAIDTLRDERAFPAWFFRIVVNESNRRLRRRRREFAFDDVSPAVPAREGSLDELTDLRFAIEGLPLSQRLPIVLHYYYGFSDAETAKIVGASHAAIRVRLFAARRKLRRLLSAQLDAPESAICHEGI